MMFTRAKLLRMQGGYAQLCLAAAAATSLTVAAAPLGTAFTYQGQLKDAGVAATGLYDLQVCLFDSTSSPIPIACAPDFEDVPVEAGLFAITLDFGSSPFGGQQRFLELRVRPGASVAGYTALTPRQLIRPTPESLRAATATSSPWSGLTGIPPGFADGIDNEGVGTISGVTAGTGLTGGGNTGAVTVAIAPGGVGATQINSSQVQARIVGICSIGSYMRGVNADGTVICDPAGGGTIITTIEDPTNFVGQYGSLAIGTDGFPVISYFDVTGAALKVAKCTNAACTGTAIITTVVASGSGRFTSIAIGTDGFPVISYENSIERAIKVAKCANAACTGAATISTVDSSTSSGFGTYSSIAVQNDGRPVISYYDSNFSALRIAFCANAACTSVSTIRSPDDVGIVGQFTSIAISTDGFPVVSYYDNTARSLKVAKCNDATCASSAITTVDDPANFVGEYSSIAIGTDGFPIISYWDQTAFSLKVAKCINASCTGTATITTVDDPYNSVGEYTSLAIGNAGRPVISYYDATASSLKVAKCITTDCTGTATITTVDYGKDVGSYTSIGIGTDGLPVISYHESSLGALKVAKCLTASCQ